MHTATLAEIRASGSPRTFPLFVLEGAASAACFFAAAFLGRNAEVHVADAGVRRVVLVDLDEARLREMAGLYPPAWEIRPGDAYALVRRMAETGESYDLVTVDPFTNAIPAALGQVRAWLTVTKRYLVIGADCAWFESRGGKPEPATVTRWLVDEGCKELAVAVAVHKRSDYRGGVYWIVLRRPGRARALPWSARDRFRRGRGSRPGGRWEGGLVMEEGASTRLPSWRVAATGSASILDVPRSLRGRA